MVNPAVQLSSKIPDKKLQIWAATLLGGMAGLSHCMLGASGQIEAGLSHCMLGASGQIGAGLSQCSSCGGG